MSSHNSPSNPSSNNHSAFVSSILNVSHIHNPLRNLFLSSPDTHQTMALSQPSAGLSPVGSGGSWYHLSKSRHYMTRHTLANYFSPSLTFQGRFSKIFPAQYLTWTRRPGQLSILWATYARLWTLSSPSHSTVSAAVTVLAMFTIQMSSHDKMNQKSGDFGQYSLPRLSVYNYDPTRDEGSESRKVDNSILNARRKGKIKVNWKILYFVSRRRELSLMRTNQCSSRRIWPSLRVINFKDMTVGKRLTEVTNLSRFIILWEWQCSYCRNVLVSLR